jgi:hypothetical protein
MRIAVPRMVIMKQKNYAKKVCMRFTRTTSSDWKWLRGADEPA